MKREMKSSIYKKIVFLLLIVIFSGCTFFQKKESTVATPEQVLTSIILDDSYRLNKYLIDGFPLNYENQEGKSLLIFALENNSLNSLKLLLTKDIDVNRVDSAGKTPIFYVKSVEALKEIVEDGADLDIREQNGDPVLIYFIKNKPLLYSEYLVGKNVNFDLKDREGWSATFWSAVAGNSELVRDMVEHGVNFLELDDKGNYPIYYAYDENILLELLEVKGYDLRKKNKNGENILGEVYLRAVANGYTKVVVRLITLGVNPNYMSYGDSAMSIAKENNNVEMLKFLKKKGLR